MSDLRGRLVAAFIAVLAGAGPIAAEPSKFSAEDLNKARTFIEKTMEPDMRAALKELARKQGISPEELFLRIRASTKSGKTLGGGSSGSDLDNVPDKDSNKKSD